MARMTTKKGNIVFFYVTARRTLPVGAVSWPARSVEFAVTVSLVGASMELHPFACDLCRREFVRMTCLVVKAADLVRYCKP